MQENSCTTRDAAKALGICVRTVQLWVEQGRLRAWKTPGGHRRILRSSIKEALQHREAQCGEELADFDVLIVEDDPIQRQLLQTKIGSISPGIKERVACNGIEGLIKFGERPPQVLVTDLLMPGLDGFHMLNTLVENPIIKPLQIIVITGMSEAEIAMRGGLPEGVTVFHKPFQLSLLLAMIRAFYDTWVEKWRISA